MNMAGSSSSSGPPEEEEEEEEEPGRLNAVDAVRDAVPVMLQVLVVCVIVWLLLPLTFNGFIIFCCLSCYLLEVEKRGRKRDRSAIASAERRKLNTMKTFDEGETSRWLNEGIKRMWPVCMQKFASKHFFGPMAPYFLDKFKPWIVKEAKMDVESVHLGSAPPVFNFIRALERPPDGDHLAYEADMDFLASNDMTAQMSVLTKGGIGTTFYISNLHIEGKVRISVKFLTGWPVVGRVRICFASTPQVTMSYRPYYKNFPDASLMPLVANLVMETLDKAMVQSIVQPNMLEVDIEALASMLSPDLPGAPAMDVSKVESKPTLVVEILEATNLIVADRNGFSDPYVEIQFGREKGKTKVIKKTLDPKWKDEQHRFSIANWDMSNLLTLRVRDSDRVRYRPSYELGIFTVPVNELYKDGKLDEDGKPYEFGKRYEFYERLDKVKRGHLRFAITVNHTHPPQAFEEPRTSDALGQTVTHTQEIKSAVDYVVNDLAGTSMKRSRSDPNLNKVDKSPPKLPKGKSKLARNNTTHDSLLEALQEQASVDETHDIITMPYGPLGAFTIFHPGSVEAPVSPPSREMAHAQPIPNATGLVNEPEGAELPVRSASRMRNPFAGIRGFVRRRRPSQESILTENMSELSGSLGSNIDYSTELKNFDLPETYNGPIRMDLIDTDVIAPEEPPEMPIHMSGPQLEPVISGKTASTVPASNSYSVQVPKDVTYEEETTASKPLVVVELIGSPSSGGLMVPTAGSEMPKGGRDDDDIASLQPQLGGSLRKPQPGKSQIFRLPKIWSKVKSLTGKAGKKKKIKDANGVAHSAEHGEDGDLDPDELDGAVSRSESFTLDPAMHYGSAPASVQGDSPELRKLIHETEQSRATGSQSDRPNRTTKVKQWIRDQSKSFRLESLHSRPKLQTPNQANSFLNSIPERPAPGSLLQRNGKVST